MDNLSIYKKVQIILLILIIITLVVFIISIKNRKKIESSLAEPVSASILEEKNENNTENESIVEEAGVVEEDTSWDEQNVEDTKVEDSEEKKVEKNSASQYYIKINYTANCITVYTRDSSGEFTVPVKAIVCSTGKATPTSGVYKMGEKYRWHQLNGGVFGQYCTRITGHILFHSVPYAARSNDSLKYVAYDKLGTKASAGCIRLTTADAIWIYSNCPSGTLVEFYSSSNPGPLGKPSAQKISSVVECRNWDPTDPADGNPWRNYKGPIETQSSTPQAEEQAVSQPVENIQIENEIIVEEPKVEVNVEEKIKEEQKENQKNNTVPEENSKTKEESNEKNSNITNTTTTNNTKDEVITENKTSDNKKSERDENLENNTKNQNNVE